MKNVTFFCKLTYCDCNCNRKLSEVMLTIDVFYNDVFYIQYLHIYCISSRSSMCVYCCNPQAHVYLQLTSLLVKFLILRPKIGLLSSTIISYLDGYEEVTLKQSKSCCGPPIHFLILLEEQEVPSQFSKTSPPNIMYSDSMTQCTKI